MNLVAIGFERGNLVDRFRWEATPIRSKSRDQLGCIERDRDSHAALAIDSMAALRPEQFEASDHRGSLGIHFNGGRQNFPSEENITFVSRQGFEIELRRKNRAHPSR